MRVTYTRGRWGELLGSSVNHCCGKMEEAWGEFVGFGEFSAYLNGDTAVNIYHCSPYPEGAVFDSIPIVYCPWCREEIIVAQEEGIS